MTKSNYLIAGAALLATGSIAHADDGEKAPWRTRVSLGPQLVPSFPGSDSVVVAPLIGVSRARGDKPFAFSAPDESASFALIDSSGFQVGPVLGFEGKRSVSDTNGLLPKVGFTVEAGAFVQYTLTPALRLRVEGRKGLGGHKGLIGTIGADYVARDADNWLFSVGPRVTFADGRYNRAYFGVAPGTPTLAAYRPGGGLQAVGAAASARHALGDRFGIYGYAKYDRLIDDAGRSPVVRTVGTRNQLSGGVALAYTFGPKGN